MNTWYIRVKTQLNGHFCACVLAEDESEAREKAIEQVRSKVPELAWAETEVLEPVPGE
jgi:hypothetical protein